MKHDHLCFVDIASSVCYHPMQLEQHVRIGQYTSQLELNNVRL